VKFLVIFSFIFLLTTPLLAQPGLKDVLSDHWASQAIAELVSLEVTAGYPDGTFRGSAPISRFEMAAFLAKLALRSGPKYQKLIHELRNEASVLKYEQQQAAFATSLSGTFTPQIKMTSTKAQAGYRLQLSMLKNFMANSWRLNLDTIDTGFNSNVNRDLATGLLDFEGRLKLDRWDWKIKVGPGPIVHTEPDNVFPAENKTVYDRPRTGVEARTRVGALDFSAGYVARQVAMSGLVGVHELTSQLGFHFGQQYLYFQPHYLFVIDGGRDVLVEAGLDWRKTNILLGYGGSGQYLRLAQKIGGWLELSYDTVSPNYRSALCQNEFIPLNNFNRYVLDGTTDLGVKITQDLSNQVGLSFKADSVAGQSEYFLWQAGLDSATSPAMTLGVFYRSYSVPSGVDQFSFAVPTNSRMVGLSLSSSF